MSNPLLQHTKDVRGQRQLETLNEIETHFDNIRAVWIYAVQHKNFAVVDAMIDGLFSFPLLRARFREGEELFDLARQALAPEPLQTPHPVWGRLLSCYAGVGAVSPRAEAASGAYNCEGLQESC